MKFIKKNYVVVAVIGLMFIAAGYLNFSNNKNFTNKMLETGILTDAAEMAEIGDAQLVSTQPTTDNNFFDEDSINNEINEKNNLDEENVTHTNAEITSDEYFTKSRLERETMYSQMLESYQKILDKTTVSETQKATAQKEIIKINEQKNAIMIAENLIKTKGFEDLIIFINDDNINVIIKVKLLESKDIALIQNIIERELGAQIDNIHISNKE